MNKKDGFTLVELLAVIFILGFILVIGIKAILPTIISSKKKVLVDEALSLMDSAKLAHESETKPDSTLKLDEKSSYCFSLSWLKEHNYYTKEIDNYSGSVLALYNVETNAYDYTFWIASDEFYVAAGKANDYEVKTGTFSDDINNCGNALASLEKTIYRRNPIYADKYMSIKPSVGSKWVIVYDKTGDFYDETIDDYIEKTVPVDLLYYDNEEICNERLYTLLNDPDMQTFVQNQKWDNARCVNKNVNYEGIGYYSESVDDIIKIEYDVYCIADDNKHSCEFIWHEVYNKDDCENAIEWYNENEPNEYQNPRCIKIADHLPFGYYLKHKVVNDVIVSTESCFFYNGEEYCIAPGIHTDDELNEIKRNVSILLNVSEEALEYGYISDFYKSADFGVGATDTGHVYFGLLLVGACNVTKMGISDCMSWV